MKIFLFLLTLLFAVWLWRRNRLNQRKDRPTPPPPSPSNTSLTPSPMQSCMHCGLHMPEADMVQGQQGHYCSLAHRQAASDKPL